METPAVVFVVIGVVKPYVLQNIRFALQWSAARDVIVISDHSTIRSLPNGVRLIHISDLVSSQRKAMLVEQLAATGTNVRWRHGYWVSILMRFEAISSLCRQIPESQPVIHVENDVATFFSREVLEPYLASAEDCVYIPPVDNEHACPGVMVATSPGAMRVACDYVVESVANGSERSDMYALGTLMTRGQVKSLPTRGGETSTSTTPQVVFDSVVVGQYLFGSDPRNSQGVSVPGYRYVKGEFDPGHLTNWHVQLGADGVQRIAAIDEGTTVSFASLHVHAKRVIPEVCADDTEWQRVLSWANAETRPELRISILKVLGYKATQFLRSVKHAFRDLDFPQSIDGEKPLHQAHTKSDSK